MAGHVEARHEATLRDFLNVVFRWKFLILSVFLLTTLLIIFVRASQPRTYASSSRVLVKRGERPSVFVPNPQYPAWAEDMSSQLEVILSEAVLSQAREIFADSLAARGLAGRRTFRGGAVRADVVGESNVIVINYSELDPLECELGCAAVTHAYVDYYQKNAAPPPIDDFFESQIGDALSDLAAWREKKSEFLNREEYLGMQEEGNHQMYILSRLETSIADVSSELSGQETRVDKLRGLVSLDIEELEERFSTTSTDSPVQTRVLADVWTELQQLRTKREELMALYTEKHPEVIAIDNQVADLRRKLIQEVRNAFDLAIAQRDELAAKYQALLNEKRRTEEQIALLPEKDKELARIESNIRANEEKYQLLLRKRDEAEIAIATSNEFDVTILSPPSRAAQRRTSDYVRLAVGPFLSLIVGLGLAFFFESMDHSLKNAAEVEQYLGTNALTTIPETRKD
jgi:uncharacterized protein involved in exopolysaccharide biosynthesis